MGNTLVQFFVLNNKTKICKNFKMLLKKYEPKRSFSGNWQGSQMLSNLCLIISNKKIELHNSCQKDHSK